MDGVNTRTSNRQTLKKPARLAPHNQISMSKLKKDWHPWDIKTALAKKGYSLASIAREYGYASTSPNQALYRPWAAMELIIANIIGVPPNSIWPSRYDGKGLPHVSRVGVRIPEHKKVCNG